MSGNYGLNFNAATGTWDTLADWTATGFYNGNVAQVPDSGSPVFLASTVQHLTVSGAADAASNITATGSAASGNIFDISGSLAVGGLAAFSAFDVIVEQGASFTGSQLALVNATMEIYGYESLSNGGGGSLSNAKITVEAGGTLVAQELNGASTDQLIVNGVLDLTGGGPGAGMSNTINAGGVVTMDAAEAVAWNINGGTFVSTNAYQTATFNFSGTGGVLDLSNDSIYNNSLTITGFNATDALILGSISGTDAVTTTIVNGNTLELIQDGSIVGVVDHFTLAPGTSISQITGTIANGHYVVNHCFYPGTRLATADGEIAVQDVTEGTMLKTATGAVLPVRWVGWSEISLRFADPLRALPVRITAGALADGVPARDLLVSPDHAVFIDDVLIQAGALVNGNSIIREENVPDSFRYYHIELATHELLLAEGCPAESFVDNVDRMHFHNWDAREAPSEAVEEMDYARAKSARQVPSDIRAAIAARVVPQAA